MKMDALTIYKYYTAIQLHFFTKSFDAWKYKFKIRADEDMLNDRNDKAFFFVLAKREYLQDEATLIDFFTAFFTIRGKIHVSNMMDDAPYFAHQAMLRELPETFKKWIIELGDINALARASEQGRPRLFNLIILKEVPQEVICILDLLSGDKILENWRLKYDDTLLLKRIAFWKKYCVYLDYRLDMRVYKEIFKSVSEDKQK